MRPKTSELPSPFYSKLQPEAPLAPEVLARGLRTLACAPSLAQLSECTLQGDAVHHIAPCPPTLTQTPGRIQKVDPP